MRNFKKQDIFGPGGIQWLRFELDEILAFVAIVGLIIHSAGLYLYVTFFTEQAFLSWNYPLRILDPLWWILAWMGGVLCLKSGMFNYSHFVWMNFSGGLLVLLSLPLTVWFGLGFSAYMLGGGFALIGFGIVRNKKYVPKEPS